MRNITAFCQHLLRLIKSAVLADTDILVKPKYRPIYQLISSYLQIFANGICIQYHNVQLVE